MNQTYYQSKLNDILVAQEHWAECGNWKPREGDWGCRRHVSARLDLATRRIASLEGIICQMRNLMDGRR